MRLSIKVKDSTEIKSVGDEIVIDGNKYIIDEITTYHETFNDIDVHYVDYTLIAVELEVSELEKLKNL